MKRLLRSRRCWLLGIALLLVAAYFGFAWYFTPPATAINRDSALKIKPGMTLAEVEAILGGPARNEIQHDGLISIGDSIGGLTTSYEFQNGDRYTTVDSRGDIPLASSKEELAQALGWVSPGGEINVMLDADARVCRVYFHAVRLYRNPAHWYNRWLNWLDEQYNPPQPPKMRVTGGVL